jgi:hypothetical protein
VVTDDDGNAAFTFTVTIPVDLGQFIAATATDPGNNTSAFAQCIEFASPRFLWLCWRVVVLWRLNPRIRRCRRSQLRARTRGRRVPGNTWINILAAAFPPRERLTDSDPLWGMPQSGICFASTWRA